MKPLILLAALLIILLAIVVMLLMGPTYCDRSSPPGPRIGEAIRIGGCP